MQNIVSEESYHDGEIIFQEGNSGDWVYVVLSGSVEISRVVEGRKHIIALLKTGEVFGELGFLGGIKRTATARAVGETTLGIIDRDFLYTEFNKIHGYFRAILITVVERFKQLIDKVSDFSPRNIPRVNKTLTLEFKDHRAAIKTFATNIGQGGLFIKTENPFHKGEQFILRIKLPDIADPLQIKSEVVWRREQLDKEKSPPGMGVKFLEMSNKDKQLLQHYLTANLMS
jgi:uncharacterized protein (TIGR02266 family)